MTDHKDIHVIGEMYDGRLAPITGELLGGARALADQGSGTVTLILIGKDTGILAREGISLGADTVVVADHESLHDFNGDAYTSLISRLCKDRQPGLCLMGQTDWGRDLAPRVAARLDAALCMDCVEVRYDGDLCCFIQTRPVYGGKAMAVMASTKGITQVDTVRPKSMVPLEPDGEREGKVFTLGDDGLDASSVKVRLIGSEELDRGGDDIENAKTIVAGGGGVGGAEGFEKIAELAKLLGGSVGATRVPVDEGVVPLSMEIGQTGKMVNPDLYVAVGISGASQHITGCINSKKIVSINKDPEANIFKVSDYGLVADYKEALPVIIEKLKSLQ